MTIFLQQISTQQQMQDAAAPIITFNENGFPSNIDNCFGYPRTTYSFTYDPEKKLFKKTASEFYGDFGMQVPVTPLGHYSINVTPQEVLDMLKESNVNGADLDKATLPLVRAQAEYELKNPANRAPDTKVQSDTIEKHR